MSNKIEDPGTIRIDGDVVVKAFNYYKDIMTKEIPFYLNMSRANDEEKISRLDMYHNNLVYTEQEVNWIKQEMKLV